MTRTPRRKNKLSSKQSGRMRGDVIGLLMGGAILGGLLLYASLSGMELPVWPAILVVVVNLVAAARVVMAIHKAKKQRQADHGARKSD